MEFAFSGPQKFIQDRMRKYSPEVFMTSLLGQKIAIFCGAKGNKFLFMNDDKLFTSFWLQSMKKALLFPEPAKGNFISILKRSYHGDFLKPEALKQYIPAMDALARQHLDSYWIPNSVVEVFPLSKKYTFELACRLFLNVVDPAHIGKLSGPFTLVTSGMLYVPVNLPGTAYHRAVKGGKLVREKVVSIVTKRRKELVMNEETEGRDLLSKMLLLTDEDGRFLSEMEVSNIFIGYLVASYMTTSSAITVVMNYLAEFPHVYREVFKGDDLFFFFSFFFRFLASKNQSSLAEQMAIAKSKGPDELLTWEDIEKMKYSWNVARESFRLMPPAQGAIRETTNEFTYAGFTIPKGSKIVWTVHSSHKNPEYFPEPEKFDPTRFEGSGPAPYTYVPFGGGSRICPGIEYARLEVLVFMHNVVTRFKLEKAIPNEKILFHAETVPAHGLPLRLHPHEK
ncbi:PREDICTED: beta-amyrin 28-oxidase-like isoform X1 [Erythranthe guttata]|uniref:beta-amyrin 28-oxidase-like isoform X1 n=1 Tax=Erythranthe guttata TaxID=4155 RepID=UPI00064DCF89|nr:PREDICTED: beta-amyrin 28-oxidase-like isoform X1 [Erythranthe guttata]|eukprot:XP_012855021.1 PREDICTED: beta-amyrin 28-oxidase-like isoform X1 [Erythranthe guttata]